MPAYDYVCQKCQKGFEIRASMSAYSAGLSPECPACESKEVERSFTSFNFVSSSGSSGEGASCNTGFT